MAAVQVHSVFFDVLKRCARVLRFFRVIPHILTTATIYLMVQINDDST